MERRFSKLNPLALTAPSTTRGASAEIPSLTGIRAVAVLVVFIGHTGLNYAPGPLGVSVFFFLSGFLITTLLRIEYDGAGTASLRNFYLRRVFRIIPPLYITLVLANLLTVAGAFNYSHLRIGAALSQVFFFSNYQILGAGWQGAHTGRAPGTGDLWSLAVEEHFYLLFPLFYLLLRRYVREPRRQAAILLGICALTLVWRYVLILGLHARFDRTYAGTDTRIDSILFGCVLAVFCNPYLDPPPGPDASRARRLAAPVLACVGLVALVLVYPWYGGLGLSISHDVDVSATLQYTIEGLALIPIFIVAIRYPLWGPIRLLNTRWLMFIGVMSYTIYISEQVIVALVHKHLPGGQVVHGPVYVVATFAFAYAMYRLVEKPCARVRKRLSGATLPTPAAALDRRAPAAAPAREAETAVTPRTGRPRPAGAGAGVDVLDALQPATSPGGSG
jgi:peptidoglycan/LPS O-acetylase OafA/YrhL